MGGDTLDPLGEKDNSENVLPEHGTLSTASEVYNLAAAGSGLPTITPEQVEAALIDDNPLNTVKQLIQGVQEEDKRVARTVTFGQFENPLLDAYTRLEIAKDQADQPYDAHAIQRQALHNVALADLYQDDTPDGEEHYEASVDYAEDVPKNIELLPESGVSQDEIRKGYQALLDHYYTQAESGATFTSRGTTGMPILNIDFLTSTLVPFRFQWPVVKIFRALGLNTNTAMTAGGTLLMGTALQKIREHIDSLPVEKKVEALGTILHILKPNSGVFKDGNDWVTAHVLSEAFETDLKGPQSAPVLAAAAAGLLPTDTAKTEKFLGHLRAGTLIDNAGSILDLANVGGLARATIKFGSKFLPSGMRLLNHVAPQLVTRELTDALTNPALRAKLADMAGADIVEQAMPSVSKEFREGGSNVLHELVARQLDIGGYMAEVAGRSNMAQAERAKAFKELTDVFGEWSARPTSTLHLDKSVMTATNDGIDILGVFGRTKDKGWGTLASAKKAKLAQVEELFGTDADVSIVMKDKKTGKLIPAEGHAMDDTRGEFFLQAADNRAYESQPTAWHSLAFGPKDITSLRFAPSSWKIFKGLSLGWTNPGSRFSKGIMDSFSTVPRARIEWNRLTQGMLSAVTGLKTSQMRQLSKVIKDGEVAKTATGVGKVYSSSELAEMGLDEATQKAYFAYRGGADFLWNVVNRQTRTRMLRDGLKDIHGPGGRVGFGKPRSPGDALADIKPGATALDVYDPATNAFTKMGAKELETAYAEGKQLARLKDPMMGATAEATHVLIDPAAKSSIKELPRAVTPRIAGYYPHMWEGNFVVYGTTKSGNRIALGLASTEADARKVVAAKRAQIQRLNTRGRSSRVRFSDVDYEFDRSLSDIGHRGALSENIYTNMGGPVYGSRNGGKLRNFSKADGDIMVEPIEALYRGFEIVGQSVTKGELALNMRQRLYNFIQSEGLKLEHPGVLPDPVSNRIVAASGGKQRAFDQAQAYLDQIEFNLRLPDNVDQAMSSFFLKTSGILSTLVGKVPFAKALSKKAAHIAAKGLDPLSTAMGLVFRGAIAADFMRQGPLQASQALVMLGVAPGHFVKAAAQMSGVAMLVNLRSLAMHGSAQLARGEWELALKAAHKMIPGMSIEELEKVVDTAFSSGLLSAVGHHTAMRASVRSFAEDRLRSTAEGLSKGAITRGVGKVVRTADKYTFGVASKVGFEAGENINQLATYLTLYNRDKAKGIANLADPDYVKRLVGSVSEFTGNMIPENGFPFQRGWFKNAFQFVGFQLKMMNLMMPEVLGGSRTISARDKLGLVLGQFLLFGRRATAYTDALYRIIDTQVNKAQAENPDSTIAADWHNPATKAVMDGLLMDYMGNKALHAILGTDKDYNISSTFAPGAGGEFLMDRLVAFAGQPGFETAAGLSGQKASKLAQFIKKASAISLAQWRDIDNIPLGDRFKELSLQGSSLFDSQINRYLAFRSAEAMDGWVNSGGTVSEGYSGTIEGALYAGLGLKTKDRESFEEAQSKYEDRLYSDPDFKDSERDKLVNDYYKDLIAFTTKLNVQASSDEVYGTMLDQWLRQRGLLYSTLPPDDAEYVSQKVNERLRNSLANKDTAEAGLVLRLTKILNDGRFGKEGPEAMMYLENAEFVKRNPRLLDIVHNAYLNATDEGTE